MDSKMSPELEKILSDLPKTSPRVVIRALDEYLPSLSDDEKKAQLNAPHSNGHGASLNFAAEYNCPDLALYLKSQGALAQTPDKDEDLPLSTAAIFNSVEVGKMLVKHREALLVNLEAVNKAGETALAAAARKNHQGLIIALIEAGANPNVYDEVGRTPLHNAALHGDERLVELLLKHGASALALTKKGEEMNAGSIARRNNRSDKITKLLDDAVDRELYKKSLDRPIPVVDFDAEIQTHPEDREFLTALQQDFSLNGNEWQKRRGVYKDTDHVESGRTAGRQ